MVRRSVQPTARRGQALAEFALVAPALTLLVLGLCWLGLTLAALGVVEAAAQAGADAAAMAWAGAGPPPHDVAAERGPAETAGRAAARALVERFPGLVHHPEVALQVDRASPAGRGAPQRWTVAVTVRGQALRLPLLPLVTLERTARRQVSTLTAAPQE